MVNQILENIFNILQEWWQAFLDNLPNLLAGLLVLVVSLYLARVFRSLARQALKRRKADPELVVLLSRVTYWSVIAFGLVLALQQAGQDITAFLTGLGIIGFTIGFALQDVSKNFVAGVLLLIQQPFDLGDTIEVAGFTGSVEQINLRDTEMLSLDGRRVSIPNGDVFTNPIINYTRTARRRIELQVGVAYESDLRLVVQTAEGAIAAVSGVLDDPPIEVVFHTFGDFALLLSIYYWHDTGRSDYRQAQSDGVMAVTEAFERAGIEMPAPMQTVTLKREGD